MLVIVSTFQKVSTKPGQAQDAFRPYIEEMERCRQAACIWALFHLVMTIPDICGALRTRDGNASGEQFRRWCSDYLPPIPLTPAERYRIRCLLLHQGRSEGDLHGKPFAYAVTQPGSWPHGDKDGNRTILDVGVLHTELVVALDDWFDALENGAAEAPLVEQNLSTLRMVQYAMVHAGPPGVAVTTVGSITVNVSDGTM